MRALARRSPKESRFSAPKESRRPSLRSSYSEISRSRSPICIRRASITAEATSPPAAERRTCECFFSSTSSSESCSLLCRHSLSLRIMPSPPCLRFDREHTPPTALAVGLEEPQEGLAGSHLRSRCGEQVDSEPSLCFRPTLRIWREDRGQAPQVLGTQVLRQIVAAYSQSFGRSLSVTKLPSGALSPHRKTPSAPEPLAALRATLVICGSNPSSP